MKANPNPYAEAPDSELKVLNLLRRLGYRLLTPEQALAARSKRLENVLLETILSDQLAAMNQFDYRGQTLKFSTTSIQSAVAALRDILDADGLLRANERVYDLLLLGKSVPETVQGDTKSYTLRYIDWNEPRNNVYHVVSQFSVQGASYVRTPDLTLFVNGIPLAVIQNKRRDGTRAVEEAIRQFLRDQSPDQGTPRLYYYAQLLLAIQPNEVKYAATGTKLDFWAQWHEELGGQSLDEQDAAILKLRSKSLEELVADDSQPTEQERQVYALCRPERLLELTSRFTLFDAGIRKVARYQQYFAVRHTLTRVQKLHLSKALSLPAGANPLTEGEMEMYRKGGVIWHTQGSGKSLTMVLLAKNLALHEHIPNSRVIIVTDRRDLDRQIYSTFQQCNKTVYRARSTRDLLRLLSDPHAQVITTVLDKFAAAQRIQPEFRDPDPNTFVLIDESHRSHAPIGDRHAHMRRMLPNACLIGFTGTPLLDKERSNLRKLGGFIEPKYTIRQAVADKAVVPLLYEGRKLDFYVNAQPLDRAADRVMEPLTPYEANEVSQKAARITTILSGPEAVREIAEDIAKHYTSTWQGTGPDGRTIFKAQLAVPSKRVAVEYLRQFRAIGKLNPKLIVRAAVVISPPGRLSAQDDPETEDDRVPAVVNFWREEVEAKFGKEGGEAYERSVITRFDSESEADDPEAVDLLIVVSKLLTGFDVQRNTVLYLARYLSDHTLLQAIARVNRLFEGKDKGYIIDYANLFDNLTGTLSLYDELSGFDGDELEATMVDVAAEVLRLPQVHSTLWGLFPREINRDAPDLEAMERHLEPEDRRDQFRVLLTEFGKLVQLAGSLLSPPELLDYYRAQFSFFTSLRQSVSTRYDDQKDFREYENRLRKLVHTHVGVAAITSLGAPIDILDEALLNRELKSQKTPASKADFIQSRIKKVIEEKRETDIVMYGKFSERLNDAIQRFQERRSTEHEYLEQVLNLREDMRRGYDNDVPAVLHSHPEARAIFNALRKTLTETSDTLTAPTRTAEANALAGAAMQIEELLRQRVIRDWQRNPDVAQQMSNDVEDYVLDHQADLVFDALPSDQKFLRLDNLLEAVLNIAKNSFITR